jgi:hypothetical protein
MFGSIPLSKSARRLGHTGSWATTRLNFTARTSFIGSEEATAFGTLRLKVGMHGLRKKRMKIMTDRDRCISQNYTDLQEAIDGAFLLVEGYAFNKRYYVCRYTGSEYYWIEFTGEVSPADRVLPDSKFYDDSKDYFDSNIHEVLGYVSRDTGKALIDEAAGLRTTFNGNKAIMEAI